MSDPSGVKLPDALAKKGIEGLEVPGGRIKGIKDLVPDLGDSELNSMIQGALSDLTTLIDEGMVDIFVGYDGTETGGTDENGNPTTRTFTYEATAQSGQFSFTYNGVTYTGQVQATFTQEETNSEQEDEN